MPVIVLTTSHFGKDIERAYDLGANSFLSKPTDLAEWVSAVRQMIRFWLFESSLPEPAPVVVGGMNTVTVPIGNIAFYRLNFSGL